MSVEPKPHILAVPLVTHGSVTGSELRQLGFSAQEVLDFSVSTNPLGPPAAVREALASLDVARYPDDGAEALRHRLAEMNEISSERVFVGNGSSEVISLLAQAFLAPDCLALVVGPTYGEYARAAKLQGCRVRVLEAEEGHGFKPDVKAIAQEVKRHRPALVFLCNPNNPTGALLDQDEIAELLGASEETLLVVDQAYLAFADPFVTLQGLLATERLFLVRSLTKDYALAGLRLGYGLGAPRAVEALWRLRPPWSVNAAAQAAGLAALEDATHLQEARRVVAEARQYLLGELKALGLAPLPSSANFLLVRVGQGSLVRQALLRQGVCVRDCASFGLPAYIRVGLRTATECRKLVEALRGLLERDSAIAAVCRGV